MKTKDVGGYRVLKMLISYLALKITEGLLLLLTNIGLIREEEE